MRSFLPDLRQAPTSYGRLHFLPRQECDGAATMIAASGFTAIAGHTLHKDSFCYKMTSSSALPWAPGTSCMDDNRTPVDPHLRMQSLGLALPALRKPVGNFLGAVQEGALLYVSGQGPVTAEAYHTGKVGAEVSVEEAYQHARLVTLNLLSTLNAHLGSLSRVKRILKVFGMVNAVPDFTMHPRVIDGCSDLLVDIFGDAGRHARSAVGMSSLPGQITVEIDLVVAIHEPS